MLRGSCRAGQELKAAWTMMQIETKRARSENPYCWPSSAVGRFRLGGQVWLGIENIKLRDSKCSKAFASKTCHFKQGRFGLALKIPNRQNMLKNSEVITIFMQVSIFPTGCSVNSCCCNNVKNCNYALWWAGSA